MAEPMNSATLARHLGSRFADDEDTFNIMELLSKMWELEKAGAGAAWDAIPDLVEVPGMVERMVGRGDPAPPQSPPQLPQPSPNQPLPPEYQQSIPPSPIRETGITNAPQPGMAVSHGPVQLPQDPGASASLEGGQISTDNLARLRRNVGSIPSDARSTGTGVSDMRSALQMAEKRKEAQRMALIDRMARSGNPELEARAKRLFDMDMKTREQATAEEQLRASIEQGSRSVDAQQTEAAAKMTAAQAALTEAEALDPKNKEQFVNAFSMGLLQPDFMGKIPPQNIQLAMALRAAKTVDEAVNMIKEIFAQQEVANEGTATANEQAEASLGG